MKKTLIAIAALAATGAFAQSTVTIDGVVDAGYVSYNYKGNGVTGIDRNLTATSGINFKASSDLGGGLKAAWLSETNFSPVSSTVNTGAVGNVGGATGVASSNTAGTTNGVASAFGGGQQFLDITGGMGRLAFGAINNAQLAFHGASQPFGTAIGSGYGLTSGSFVTAATRSDNSFKYESPAFGGGFQISFINRKGQSVTGTNSAFSSATLGVQAQAQQNDMSLAYSAGPLNAILVRASSDSSNVATVTAGTGVVAIPVATAGKGIFTALAANYNMGAWTVYGGYQLNKLSPFIGANLIDRQTVTAAAKYVAGVHTMMGSYQRASNNLVFAAPLTAGSGLLGLGYEYALSKTAALTARYERINDTANLAVITGFTAVSGATDRTRMGVGLRVGF